MPRFHPSRDFTPGRDCPSMDTWRAAESLEFVAAPERPVAVVARVADENIGHAAKPRSGTVQPGQGTFSSWFARYARPMRQGCPSLARNSRAAAVRASPLSEDRQTWFRSLPTAKVRQNTSIGEEAPCLIMRTRAADIARDAAEGVKSRHLRAAEKVTACHPCAV